MSAWHLRTCWTLLAVLLLWSTALPLARAWATTPDHLVEICTPEGVRALDAAESGQTDPDRTPGARTADFHCLFCPTLAGATILGAAALPGHLVLLEAEGLPVPPVAQPRGPASDGLPPPPRSPPTINPA